MLFNSFEYLVFLPIVFLLYWFVLKKNLKKQNLLLLIASYVFYGLWDWRFLFLIIFSSFIDYFCGLAIQNAKQQRIKKRFLTISMFVNLGFLGVFKYFNFFSKSLEEGLLNFGYKMDALTLNVILPVGISFYTFQTMSYTIDVYRNKLKPTNDIIAFFAFVSFFPQLVAGPIERATNLLPQFYLNLAKKTNVKYINYSKDNIYETYDGNHLDKYGGITFTKNLCDSIRLNLRY